MKTKHTILVMSAFATMSLTSCHKHDTTAPGAITAAHTVTFTTAGNETYVWEMSKDIPKLEAGKIYAYDVTVTKHAVTANGSINPWDKGTSGSGFAQ